MGSERTKIQKFFPNDSSDSWSKVYFVQYQSVFHFSFALLECVIKDQVRVVAQGGQPALKSGDFGH